MLDRTVILIFITNMAQYAIRGYEVDALDYVLKPVSYYSFEMKMKKVRRILAERQGNSVVLSSKGSSAAFRYVLFYMWKCEITACITTLAKGNSRLPEA